jgi:hypothetical protein
MTDIKVGDDEDREFDARTILYRRGVQLEEWRPFTLEQIESLAEVVKSWDQEADR